MIKRFFVVFIMLLQGFSHLRADEGMWLPLLIDRLNYTDMQKAGLRLTAEEIYSINHSSLKDAIVLFGRGCTGELVSAQGLLFTNHHCGYGRIQAHSTVEHDYLTDGFWALSLHEELPNPGLEVRILLMMENVTNKILPLLPSGAGEEARSKKVGEIAAELEKKAKNGVDYHEAVVKSFFNGNEYYLFLYEVYKDVRLVGAPPSSVGKFGGDTDNWMWPRHTGDFSIFRVYTGPDGKPAPYAKDNIPLKPRHFLPVSIKGVEKNDYAMVYGYPGSTDRYLTSYGVKLAIEETNPTVVAIREKRLEIIRAAMKADKAINIQYASKYAMISNYWKYFIGQTKGLKRLKVYEKKQALEAAFTEWYSADPGRKERYGEVLGGIAAAYAEIGKVAKTRIYYTEGLLRGAEAIGLARNYVSLYKQLKSGDKALPEKTLSELREKLSGYFKDYNASVDESLFALVLGIFAREVPVAGHPAILAEVNRKYKGDFKKYAAEVYAKSIFTSKERLTAFLDNPRAKVLEKDPVFRCAQSFSESYNLLNDTYNAAQQPLEGYDRLFLAGLREMNPDKKYYPDANQTLRLTYGKVLDYFPADAVHYDFKTTLGGVMEKEEPGSYEFSVPDKLKSLYAAKDFGPYASNGEIVTCFITTNDITGGNSGSPVINANGELIGLAFDGNWEAMSGDIAFEEELQRTINVDIRYVLFIIDKFAGAKNLIDELSIRQ
ncbi:MAG TPA: S46 family peptidase [Bacteroidales bacterium]|nr:S46 family peptidase [Bacteroidales bacterium]HSA43674.1 S46 family peptidase [Bacteroidales bacterium]